jgi:hypothetical protein
MRITMVSSSSNDASGVAGREATLRLMQDLKVVVATSFLRIDCSLGCERRRNVHIWGRSFHSRLWLIGVSSLNAAIIAAAMVVFGMSTCANWACSVFVLAELCRVSEFAVFVACGDWGGWKHLFAIAPRREEPDGFSKKGSLFGGNRDDHRGDSLHAVFMVGFEGPCSWDDGAIEKANRIFPAWEQFGWVEGENVAWNVMHGLFGNGWSQVKGDVGVVTTWEFGI